GRSSPDCSSQEHSGSDIHAGAKLSVGVLPRLDDDLGGNALNDLDVVAGRVFGRKQTEKRTRGSSNAVNVPLVLAARGIDVDLRTLPRTDMAKLRLLEVRGDPHVVERHHGQQLLARLNVHAEHDGLVHLPVYGRDHARVEQIQLRLL